MTSKAALVLPVGADEWRAANLAAGFARVAEDLAGGGFEVEVFALPGAATELPARVTTLAWSDPPILAGPAAAHLSLSLRAGHQLWRRLAANPPDIVLAPLGGGILQPALMSRDLGESLGDTAMVLWGEAGAARRMELGDIEPVGVEAVIAEAMESAARRLADATARPDASADRPGEIRLAFPFRPSPRTASRGGRTQEIVCVGPASGRHGADAFLTVIERLGHEGVLTGRTVTFLGPWREGTAGLGKAMLGRRARDWRFAFTQVDESRPGKVLDHLRRPGVLAVFPGAAADDEVILADCLSAGVASVVASHHPMASWVSGAASIIDPDLADLADHFDSVVAQRPPAFETPDWPEVFESAIAARRSSPVVRTRQTRSASLCITHRDRPDALAAALASRGGTAGLTTIVVDTGSETATLDALGALESDDVRIIQGSPGARQPWARNLAAEHAGGDILIFLDDDNLFIDDGLARLVAAFEDPRIDIVVSTLSLFDGAPGQGLPAADLVFMGEAGWAGLLYNGFGDANFAIRRDRFAEIGCFADDDVAAFDWVFFAKAQARGLTIAVLQKPAIAYRRDLFGRDAKWRKRDLEGPRRHVLRAYEIGQTSKIIAALGQCLSLPFVE
ncbi:MAG TPA: glycosyltransferase family A protein [Caulobacteraceae bacterium]